MDFRNMLLENQKFNKISKKINGKNIRISGLSSSRISYFAVNFLEKAEKDIIFFLPDNYSLQQMQEDLLRLINKEDFLVFPEEEILPHEQLMPDLTTMSERTKVLTELIFNGKQRKIILTTPAAVFKKLSPPKIYMENSILIDENSEIDLKEFNKKLFTLGYKREEMVEAPGQYSIRGGIIDVFTLLDEQPFRIELFGDQVDSIRKIDLSAQRSKEEITELIIPPFANLIIDEEVVKRAYPKIKKAYEEAVKRLVENDMNEEADYLKNKAKMMLEDLEEKHRFPGFEQFLPYYYKNPASFFDYLSESIIFSVRPDKISKKRKSYYQEILDTQSRLLEQGIVLPDYIKNFLTEKEFKNGFNENKVVEITSDFDKRKSDVNEINFDTESIEPFHGQLELFSDKVELLLKKGYKVAVTLNSSSKKRRIKMFLEDKGFIISNDFSESKLAVFADSLAEGFVFNDIKLAVFTDKEVFGSEQKRKRKIGDFEDGVEINSIDDLKSGDYVVHENHGIGKYLGVKTLEIQGQHKDYLVLKYKGEDKLYVPTDKINLVQKYIGSDSGKPKLYKLGSSDWKKVKEKVEKSVKEMAIGLLELYAERETLTGYQFSEDKLWQQEFEESFSFEETPDQKEAIKDVKSDMESKKPMDRLLCGDVGYGKTEVAIRAAFKAALDGKQTAVLVPTTILAQQHFNTFEDRIADFPVNVEMLSRFKTGAEQRKTLKRLIKGEVDILIGTHRLLSKDVIFDDLGLLVIDEEQRFGVTHKEKLKDLKRNVDVLTLTATPIPRTLHMALVGVRDMSLIETPPENRYPIRTFIKEKNKELITSSVRRELARDGQIYFVHNRVEDIEKTAGDLQKILPEAKIAVAHGQMREKRLEKIMYDFYHHEFDILVCTTIIETGLDIQNVNTIIINHADKMGLSQLYQLRGRVGRTNRIAYAYLLYERDRILPEIAEKRLEAIKEFSSLGSGFKIAMRDLEIRGAGNLLGPEQSGHISAVGFSLYTKLLEGTIEELKGKKESKKIEVEVDLNLDAYIPDDYIKYEARKIEIYKKIKDIKSESDVLDVIDELIDRFGEPPKEVLRLINTARLKVLASKLNINLIRQEGKVIRCQFIDAQSVDGRKLVEFSQKYARRIKIRSAKKPQILIKTRKSSEIDKELIKILNYLKNIRLQAEEKTKGVAYGEKK
ncbi:MAG: transcription-repair coupling factor [Halanaerobium sp.]